MTGFMKGKGAACMVLAAVLALTGCGGGTPAAEAQPAAESSVAVSGQPQGLPEGFPGSLPFYSGAEVMEADNFNGNNYTVVYSVAADYQDVVDFYKKALPGMDSGDVGEDAAYFTAVDSGKLHIKGLTIERSGDGTQVFITVRDDGQDPESEAGEGEAEEWEEDGESAAEREGDMTYETAAEEPLASDYPSDVVPIPDNAKIMACSVAPSGSGFVNLILPTDAYEETVAFYADELGLKSKNFTSEIMVSETFSGTVKGWRVSVAIGQNLGRGNDPTVSITVDK